MSYKTNYEVVIDYLRERANEVRGEWDGDEPGVQEDRSSAAGELLELLDEVDKVVKELDL